VLTTRAVHKNGQKLYVDLSVALMKDDGGTVTGSLAIARHCTARFTSDRALGTRVSESEQQLEAGS
jgi:hypothetical protein